MPVLYILYSPRTNKYYTGSSHEDTPAPRLLAHNSGKVRSTQTGRPWLLIHLEYFENYTNARKRELFLKSGAGRKWVKEHVGKPLK